MNIAKAFEHARKLHQNGRLAEAREDYLRILAAEPRHADALHLLGVLAGQTGKNHMAVDCIRQSIAVRADHAESHRNLAIALKGTGRLEEAAAACRRAIELMPDYADAFKSLGGILHAQGLLEEAIAAYRQAVACKPDHAEAHDLLGVVLRENGRFGEAIAACRRAVSLKPDSPEAHNNLGNALHDEGRNGDAIEAYRTAVQLRPNFAQGYNNLGVALMTRARHGEAIAAFRTALHWKRDYAEACIHLGTALRDSGEMEQAITVFRKAIAMKPDSAEAVGNLAHTLKDAGRTGEAIAAYRKAIAMKPDSPDWQHVLAALTGDASAKTTPASYVRKLFDPYARDFDDHLVGQLGYRVPGQFLDAILAVAPGRKFDILDLGCGTGLCGVRFRDVAKSLTGVDLSPAMIAKAGARGIYDRLMTADIAEALRGEDCHDLILAGDLFVYVGDLGATFREAALVLRRGGLFAFSLERHDGEGFVLHSKVRFAHSLAYIRGLSHTHGFAELTVREIAVRKSGAEDVPGWIVVLQKPSAAPA